MTTWTEERTVTTRGHFHDIIHNLMSDRYPNGTIATTSLGDEHRVHDPRRLPVENVYRTNCPHQFRLYKRKVVRTAMAPSFSIHIPQPVEEELVVELSDSVYEMYSDWTMKWEFGTHPGGLQLATQFGTQSGFQSDSQVISRATITPDRDAVEWKTIIVGEAQSLLARHFPNDILCFTVTWTRQESSPKLKSTQHELEELKRAMTQMCTSMFETFNRPSIEITHLVFRSKRSGIYKHLYVPSHVLAQFEYFQRCHSAEYSETQHGNDLQREANQDRKPQ
ncbi:hypothetical protein DFH28DRAFT_1216252 [Melampsora americana]|nr:hypothetical protein DFH28DRAFT_1216252 [Melampsora americana]